jgi:ABC-2 type transport system ATP-binding protein
MFHMHAAIEASELTKTYSDVQAVNGVSLAVPAGTIFGLLGPNGAGKSTTMRMLCTLTRPTGGQARVAGVDVLADPTGVRRRIGVVGQMRGADPEASGRENLILQGEFYGLARREVRARTVQSLQRFGLQAAADRLVKTYSGGMQRRLDVAMGLLHRPQVLFLDEPTSGLDPEARVEMWHEIERLAVEERMTILLTTHYMEEADRLAAQLAIIDRGRIVIQGTPSELKSALDGDAVQVELAEGDAGAAAAAIAALGELSEVQRDGATVRARARDGAAAIPRVLAALEREGLAVVSATVARPSLDDVYLRYAGRAYRESDTPDMAVAA